MSELSTIKEHILKLSQECSLHVTESSENYFKIYTDAASGITLIINIKGPTDFSFYFLERTYDVVYNGDRSDVHVIVSLMFASFIRLFDSRISCSLFDIPHPVIEDEIWGRYIMPEQNPSLFGISTWEQLTEEVSKLIVAVAFWRDIFWKFAGCPCDECLKKINLEENFREYDIPVEMDHSKNNLLKSSKSLNSGNRHRPNWSFFYDMQNEITIIKSEELSDYLKYLIRVFKYSYSKANGIKGKLLLHGELRNFLSNSFYRELRKIKNALGQSTSTEDSDVIPMENMIVTVSKPYIIAQGKLSGIIEFKSEKELVRQRHNHESQLLFPVPSFDWKENICPDQFEGLIKSLLERDPNIKSVRRASPINQGDRGRDLIIEWNIRSGKHISKSHPPTLLIAVVGQCKASNKAVGKGKVIDIRDTVETHNAQGYFLAVSTQISEPLTQKLEELRTKGIWTDWWNREDIEMRLSKNEDLWPLFPKVLSPKKHIKYVEKE